MNADKKAQFFYRRSSAFIGGQYFWFSALVI